jgi:hypothetical protein
MARGGHYQNTAATRSLSFTSPYLEVPEAGALTSTSVSSMSMSHSTKVSVGKRVVTTVPKVSGGKRVVTSTIGSGSAPKKKMRGLSPSD